MIKVLTNFISGEKSLPGLQMAALLLWPYMIFPLCACGEWERANSLMSPLIRSLILSDQDPILMTSFNLDYFLKSSISKYIQTKNLSFNIWILGAHKPLVHNKSPTLLYSLQWLLGCSFSLWLWTVILHKYHRVGMEVVGIQKVIMQKAVCFLV